MRGHAGYMARFFPLKTWRRCWTGCARPGSASSCATASSICLHIGHVRHFEQARELGDVLVVTLTPDRFVNKGVGRPAFTETLRAEFLASLGCVDYVAVNRWPTAVETIRLLRPAVFAKGSEFRGLKDTIGHVSQGGGGDSRSRRRYRLHRRSRLQLVRAHQPVSCRRIRTRFAITCADFAARHSAEKVLAPLRAAEKLRVLVVGETIIDEYTYCEAIGKSGKEPVLATRFVGADRFGGGVLACANHLASFVKSVDVFTQLGEGGDEEEFVRGVLKPNVTPIFLEKPGSPTIVKQRFVEKYLVAEDVRGLPHERRAARRGRGCGTLRSPAQDAAEVRSS